MLSDWQAREDGAWVVDGFDGHWVIERSGDAWVAVPPNGCSYPYALVASMFRAPCLQSIKHAARDCMEYQYETIGVPALRERGHAKATGRLHRQFLVGSCGISYSIEQAAPGGDWVAKWSGWDQHGQIEHDFLPELIGRLRTPFLIGKGYCPPGLRAALVAEDQRIETRCWTLNQFSKSEAALEAARAEMEKGDNTVALGAMSWGGRSEAYSLSLVQQVKDEATLVTQSVDPDVYPGLI